MRERERERERERIQQKVKKSQKVAISKNEKVAIFSILQNIPISIFQLISTLLKNELHQVS
jgi:hypothetical protein